MGQRAMAIWAVITLATTGATTGATAGAAAAQTPTPAAASHVGDIPQAIRLEHEEMIKHLSIMAKRHTPVGAIAGKALVVMRQHYQQELEFILPPLTLLQSLADGKVSPDMKWAIAMGDRVKAEREKIFETHVQISDLMNQLLHAAEKAHDNDAKEFAEGAVQDALSDMEMQEPMAIVIGDYLRAKLPASP